MLLLILEDDPKDVRFAEKAARSEGFDEIEAFTSVASALQRVEQSLHGKGRMPDAFLIDLDLGWESGYEMLRRWYIKPTKPKTHIIVWSQLEEQNREICSLFNVNAYVCKQNSQTPLREALRNVNLSAATL